MDAIDTHDRGSQDVEEIVRRICGVLGVDPDNPPKQPLPFMDLKGQLARIRPQVDAAIARVLDHGQFIMGPEVYELERQLCAFTGAKHCISCSNGTDALALGLMALGVNPGDAVLVPSFSFAATAEVVPWLGAVPIFCDVLKDTFNLDPKSLEAGVATAKRLGLRAVGVIPVDLFGLPADYDSLLPVAEAHDLWVMCDAAQSFGAIYKGRKVGTLARISTTSFFPAKPLGCYGDGGAIFTDDDDLARVMRSLRVHGQGADKYDNVRIGMNARLDTMQAAVVLEKLMIFRQELVERNDLAIAYGRALMGYAHIPKVPEGLTTVWAQYTICHDDRDAIARNLLKHGIPSAVYYVKPLHYQEAYRRYPTATRKLPTSEYLSSAALSLSMYL